ncbi:MAG: hypothetical protein ABIR25_01830 [Sphingomicrobium sp.]
MTKVAVAVALSATPAFATASAVSVPARTISPMVALSIFGSQASAAALCGSSATTVAGAAATAQAPVGCVLPVVDAPPVVPVAEAAPVTPIPVAPGFGISPVLLGLAGIAILAALIISQDNDNDNSPPVSVN